MSIISLLCGVDCLQSSRDCPDPKLIECLGFGGSVCRPSNLPGNEREIVYGCPWGQAYRILPDDMPAAACSADLQIITLWRIALSDSRDSGFILICFIELNTYLNSSECSLTSTARERVLRLGRNGDL